jgi:anti-sigma-K factor RskA
VALPPGRFVDRMWRPNRVRPYLRGMPRWRQTAAAATVVALAVAVHLLVERRREASGVVGSEEAPRAPGCEHDLCTWCVAAGRMRTLRGCCAEEDCWRAQLHVLVG